jgi:DNA-binding NtrC family response regulator
MVQTTSMERGGATSEATRRGRVLLVEDDDSLADLLARVLRAEGYQVEVTDRATALPPPSRLGSFDVVLTDVHLEEGTGYDVLRAVRASAPSTPVILVTAFADVEGAMAAVGEGAYDYLPKPIDPSQLKRMIAEAIARRGLASQAVEPERGRDGGKEIAIVGSTPAMIEVYKTVAQVAATRATVLIIGESGTGKELVARAIHARSERAGKPFVAVNCAALPESILESELFGHERGAFTGATGMKRGLFEEATGGTLFLDEIGEISPKMQAQLLRVLQEGEIRRVGGSEPVKTDVRVVASTNRDLKTEVAAGRFREDLYFRLNVVTVKVPPLRDRRGDVPALVRHFLARHAERLGRPVPRVAPEVIERLSEYEWPGNVRELSHLVERAMLLARERVVTLADLPPELSPHAVAPNPGSIAADWPTLEVLDRRYIDLVLARTGGNKTRAAEVLGIDRRTLNRIFARERAALAAAAGLAPPPEDDDDDES